MSMHQIWGEKTKGETTRGELVLGGNDLLPFEQNVTQNIRPKNGT